MHLSPSFPRRAVKHLLSFALALCAAAATAAEPPLLSSEPPGTVSPTSGSATLYWTDPITSEDGTPLSDLAGYRLYYGKSPSDLSNIVQLPDASVDAYTIRNLGRATWYFGITAYTTTGLESSMSAIVSKIVN